MNTDTRSIHWSLFVLAGIVTIIALLPAASFSQQKKPASPDVKKKEFNLRYTAQTRTEMANMPIRMPSTSTTVYIKGRRHREEDPQRQLITIEQCDLQQYVYINQRNQTCFQKPFSEQDQLPETVGPMPPDQNEREAPPPRGKPRKGGLVVIEGEVTDTGERKEMFGLKARHIISKQIFEAKPESCNPGRFEMTMDVWLVDLPEWRCRHIEKPAVRMPPGRPTRPDCQDTMRVNMKGNPALLDGFELYSKITTIVEGQAVSVIYEVTELSLAELDPALFEKPANCREIRDEQAFWKQVKSPDGFSIAEMMRGAREAAEKEAAGETAMKPKRAGMVRVGVSLKDQSGASLDIAELRHQMVSTINQRSGDALDAVPLLATASPSLQTEASSKQVDYILLVDVREAKPDTGRKLGGLLGRAAGVDVKDKTSVKLDYQWIQASNMQTLSNRSLSDKVTGSVSEAMEQFCRKSAEDALKEFWRIRR
ncbi:MAG: hypothetical protein NZ823_13395 [Blastocatellia bacterium]|nr:hypothetical protein [Blastocatellia bacterium]